MFIIKIHGPFFSDLSFLCWKFLDKVYFSGKRSKQHHTHDREMIMFLSPQTTTLSIRIHQYTRYHGSSVPTDLANWGPSGPDQQNFTARSLLIRTGPFGKRIWWNISERNLCIMLKKESNIPGSIKIWITYISILTRKSVLKKIKVPRGHCNLN